MLNINQIKILCLSRNITINSTCISVHILIKQTENMSRLGDPERCHNQLIALDSIMVAVEGRDSLYLLSLKGRYSLYLLSVKGRDCLYLLSVEGRDSQGSESLPSIHYR